MKLEILPLAITMMAGPQIMSAIVFVTSKEAVRVSFAFVVGVAIATAVGVAITAGLTHLAEGGGSLGSPSNTGSAGTLIQIVLVALLVLAAVKNYVGRETAEPPRWLGALQAADPKKAFATGLFVILLMPSDIVIMLTVGLNLTQSDSSYSEALPFVAATVLVAAFPLLGYLVFQRRAAQTMPKVRDWMNTKSWLVNIIVCGVFVLLILS